MVTRRTGARKMADVSPALRRRLDRGEEEALTLVEWLVVDQRALAKTVLPTVGFTEREVTRIITLYDDAASDGVLSRLRGMAGAIHQTLSSAKEKRRAHLYEGIAGWATSDIVREWGALIISANDAITPDARWNAIRRYAADASMNVREIAWMALRPWIAADLPGAIERYTSWVTDPHEGIRRCAIEGTRPRGVWTRHLTALKADPTPAAPLLESVRSDPSRYVQNAVGNWLNDASKDHPDWARDVTARWSQESPTKETAYIVKRALRTLAKS